MVKVDILLAILGLGGAGVITFIVRVGLRSWRQGAGLPYVEPVRRPELDYAQGPAPDYVQTGAMRRSTWHARLDELHFILVQVVASDGTLAQLLPLLPLDLATVLRKYFSRYASMPPAPSDEDALINRVMLLEQWLLEVDAASHNTSMTSLPPELVRRIRDYVDARERRIRQS